MKTHKLPELLKGKGEVRDYTFKKITESERGYIYAQINDKSQKTVAFEVFKKTTSPICIDFENRIYSKTEVKELYPKSRHFGRSAWTYNCLDKAKLKLKEL